MRALIIALAVLWTPTLARAHGFDPQEDFGWTFSPLFVAPLGVALAFFALGHIRRLARTRTAAQSLRRHAGWFLLGWVILFFTLTSPLHEAGERSFTAHMIEHEIIMMVAAPLLALSHAGPTFLWGFAPPWRSWIGRSIARTRPFWQALLNPLSATVLQAAALWLWHAPALFDRALADPLWHDLQHLSFFVTALIFWTAMFDRRRDAGLRALCLFATSIVSGALGALMAISLSPWYAPYAALGMTPQGLTAAQDQQLAGVLMWAPGGFVHAGAALGLLAPLLRSQDMMERMR